MNINLEYYKVFYNVVKYNGISAAAEKMCISQPAVSQAVKQLESELGSRLFLRSPKGIRLTPEGDMLYSYVKEGYEHILIGEKMLKKMLGLENGEVRIGASDMTLEYYLLPYLEKFHEQYPQIKVTVTNGPTPETINYLYEGKIDFGIVSSPFDARADIKIKNVRKIKNVFVAGKEMVNIKDKTLSYNDLVNYPLICLEENTSTRKFMDEFLMKNGIKLEPEFELATSDMIVQFALRNLGIGCVVSDFASKYIESEELFTLKFDKDMPERNMCIITSDKNPISKAGETLLNMLI